MKYPRLSLSCIIAITNIFLTYSSCAEHSDGVTILREMDITQEGRKILVTLGMPTTSPVSEKSQHEAEDEGIHRIPRSFRTLSVKLRSSDGLQIILWKTEIDATPGSQAEVKINGLLVKQNLAMLLYSTSKTHLVLMPMLSDLPSLPKSQEFFLAETNAFSLIEDANLAVVNGEVRATIELDPGGIRVWRVTSNYNLEKLTDHVE